MEQSGLKRVAQYSLKPHELKICGPKEYYRTLYDWIAGKNKTETRRIMEILKKRPVAYPYLKLIAASNEIENPFHPRVVEAYWIGNELLENVGQESFKKMIRDIAPNKAEKIEKKAFPHHNFHVLCVGSVTGNVSSRPSSLQLCCISWSKVEKVKENQITTCGPCLKKSNNEMVLEEESSKKQKLEYDKSTTEDLSRGDIVAHHWGKVCEKISNDQRTRLTKYTKKALKFRNHH